MDSKVPLYTYSGGDHYNYAVVGISHKVNLQNNY